MKPSQYLFTVTILIVISGIWFLSNPKKQSEKEVNNTKSHSARADSAFLQIKQLSDAYPLIPDSQSQIRHLIAFDLSYNETHEQANWVLYVLTRDELAGTEKRKDNFRNDPEIRTGSASLKDYESSGYDRGHLAPAADMKWSEEVMSESFYMSNMSPQKPWFNRGIWKKLEEYVRDLVLQNDSILVISGPVFIDNLGAIGANEVTVPGYYFKVLFDLTWPDNKAIAYLMKNEKSDKELSDFAISIDSLEIFCGYDFFYQLEGVEEEESLTNLILNY